MARYRRVGKRIVRTPPPTVAPEPAQDYGSLLKADLVALAQERGLDSSGTKADIVARLEGGA